MQGLAALKGTKVTFTVEKSKRYITGSIQTFDNIFEGKRINGFSFPFSFFFAVSQFRVCILQRTHFKANYVTTPREGCPNPKAPPNAAHKCVLLFPVFGGCTASHIPRFFAHP